MQTEKILEQIAALIKKAADASYPIEALQFSQAAANAANACCAMINISQQTNISKVAPC